MARSASHACDASLRYKGSRLCMQARDNERRRQARAPNTAQALSSDQRVDVQILIVRLRSGNPQYVSTAASLRHDSGLDCGRPQGATSSEYANALLQHPGRHP